MSLFAPLMPKQPVPDLSVPLSGGGSWRLHDQKPENFTLVVFYRGLHCPICKTHLRDLQSKIDELSKLGTDVVAVSTDTRERAEQARVAWDLVRLPLAYGLTLSQARSFGLYISRGRGTTSLGITEPEYFAEPGVFLVSRDATLYFASVQTMPFARPSLADLCKAIEYVIAKRYPARGDVTNWE